LRRLPAIFLLVAFLALGTGALEYLHNLDHQREDARLAGAGVNHSDSPAHRNHAPIHNDTNCETHAQLHMPTIAAGWMPLLVFAGLFVAFLTLLAADPVSHRPLPRLDCRGPPAC
jgi:hypothetical protein